MGVFLLSVIQVPSQSRLPHARGGVSQAASNGNTPMQSSPRPWGGFSSMSAASLLDKVFPTPVGVFLLHSLTHGEQPSLPHARGGVSLSFQLFHRRRESSPRPWGCFSQSLRLFAHPPVFPTPVGVFPNGRTGTATCWGLPHARGGVSHIF